MTEGRVPLPGPDFYLLPHARAPLFSEENPRSAQLLIQQLISEVSSGNFPDSEAFISLLAQAGLVSLWLFLKVILGFAGPYDELNTDLHREMCNFRQGPWCMLPGARAAILLPRSFLKSTIMTHGADHWELTRNPDECIAIANATASKAEGWRDTIKTSTEKNQLYRACYPWMIPGKDAKRWNNSELVFPGRTRNFTEPSIYAIGVGAASEGLHFTIFNPDDLVGLDDLDVEHLGNMNMLGKLQWFKTNRRALLRKQKKSRIIFPMTRFSIDDPSSYILEDCKKVFGYALEEFEEKPNGTWTVYNRLGEEDGVMVLPEVLDKEDLSKQMDDDYWGAMTQSLNRPAKTGVVEFHDYRIKPASLEWVEEEKRFWIHLGEETNFEDEQARKRHVKPASAFDWVMGLDPAGTETGIDAKVSRTGVSIWAVDSEENCVLVWGQCGYFPAVEANEKGELVGGWFKMLFDGARRFHGLVRCCVVEAAAMQKVLAPILRREALVQNYPLYFKPVPATGDKDARIRLKFQPLLARGKIYSVVGPDIHLKGEVKVFPGSRWRKDFLDCSEKALSESNPPRTEEEELDRERVEESAALDVSLVTGY